MEAVDWLEEDAVAADPRSTRAYERALADRAWRRLESEFTTVSGAQAAHGDAGRRR